MLRPNIPVMKRFLFLLLFTACYTACIFAQETAQWRGPGRDGIYPDKGLMNVWPANGPPLMWHYDSLGEGHSSAVVTSNRIYTAGILGGIGYLYCFDFSGKLLWKVPYGEEWVESWPGVRSTPVIFNGKIYQYSGFGKLICRKAETGAFVWSVDVLKDYQAPNIKWGVTENLLIDDNKLFCTAGGPEANVIALDPETGRLIWKSRGKGETSAYGSPAMIKLADKHILVAQTANSILGIDAKNGNLLWSHDQPNKYSVHANTPLYHDGYLYCVSGYGKGGVMLKVANDGNSVQEVWRNTSIDNRMGGFVLVNGKIFGSDDSGKAWYCLDWKTGTNMYSEKITGRGNIIYADGRLYLYGDNGEVVLAEPLANSFKKVSAFMVPFGADQHWAHLVIGHGCLFVRHGGSLMGYDIRKK
jgi:outer membrane protein assembly factor BamB